MNTENMKDLEYNCPVGRCVMRLGDVIQIDGGLAIVEMINDCRARAIPLDKGKREIKDRFSDQSITVEFVKTPVSISPYTDPNRILERRGESGLQTFLESRKPKRAPETVTPNPIGEERTEESMATKTATKSADKEADKVAKRAPKREAHIKPEGTAAAGEKVKVSFKGRAKYTASLASDASLTTEKIHEMSAAKYPGCSKASTVAIVNRARAK